ncbi:hypothetical protein CYLTODRAFT_445966 [Cylindrobasidium torrendii FP15055 ss-10]|uniref:Glutathione S-transferase n=1 Tax=Cylindrobasidium torrendii FP15055 ss-10 TaxID=1314674 RepID=A0A0D7B2U2_9AGAR|nr:hypothetical protein CYLTODRAFT_445966 [Cylindrobasidium torrendii FP15055 ss-10]
MAPLTLYLFPWGPFPRRVLVYLKIKGIPKDAINIVDVGLGPSGFINPGDKPDGTVPILRLEDGTLIHQSMGVLTYLEEVFANVGPNMSGSTAVERARIRDMCSVVDETVESLYAFAWNTSKLFADRNKNPSKDAADRALSKAKASLVKLAGYANESKGTTEYLLRGENPTVADVTLFTLLQHLKEGFGEELTSGIPRLEEFYKEMRRNEGTEPPDYPAPIVALARQRVSYEQL